MRIAIVGGGIGGLAAALFLRQAGLDATVYEQAAELREGGAGVVVSPNSDMVREFVGWDGRLQQLIAAATDTKRWALYDRSPLERWTSGRISLLGDAAHAMLPFFGQGASQSIEDAAVLAACRRNAGPDSAAQALLRYEAVRRPRASQVQLMSRGREARNHLPDGPEQQQRGSQLARGDPLRDSAWLYGHDPDSALAAQ